MIRFSYDPPKDRNFAFEHFSLEGDNERGYVLLAWSSAPAEDGEPKMMQAWFETLGEALNHCVSEHCIMREDWHAPTVAPPVSKFERSDRGRRTRESNVLNEKNVRDREDKNNPPKG